MAEKKRRKRGEFAVVVVCIIVGYLLAAQLRSVQLTGAADATNASRLETLQELYNEQSKQNDALEDQVAQLQDELSIYRDQAASGTEGSEALRQELEQLEIAAGRTDVEGPGVTVILQDSSQTNVTGDEADYLIHDNDLLSVVNELRSAGAEAISLNGERLLANSEIRCTYSALTMRNGVVDVLSQWGISVQVTASDLLLIPKYNGTVTYQYAHTVTSDSAEREEGGE